MDSPITVDPSTGKWSTDDLIEATLQAVQRGSPLAADSPVAAFVQKLASPVAVYPYRQRPRLIAQYAMFTVHGGMRGAETDWGLPVAIEDVDATARPTWGPVLRKFRVPAASKAAILSDLAAIGVRRDVLFPEPEFLAAKYRNPRRT